MSLFLDFDKTDTIVYSNLYLDEFKLVVKVPITDKERAKNEPKVEKFDLGKYTYLCHCD